jgi:hypothetical protein
MKYGVPVALATDDQGVSRSNMTHEYLRAVETYGLSYTELKHMGRNSLEHSFLPGESLWQGDFRMVSACAPDRPQKEKISSTCRKFLDASEKAEIQWQLEKKFENFEEKY